MTRTKDLLALYLDGLEIVHEGGPTNPATGKNVWPCLYTPRNPSDPHPWTARNGFYRFSSREVHCPDVGGGPVTLAHKKVAADVARLRTYGWTVEVSTARYPSVMREHTRVQVSATRLWWEGHIVWSYTTSVWPETKRQSTRFNGSFIRYGINSELIEVSNYRGLWYRILESEHGLGTRYCGDFTTAGQHHRHNADQGRTRPSEPWLTDEEITSV